MYFDTVSGHQREALLKNAGKPLHRRILRPLKGIIVSDEAKIILSFPSQICPAAIQEEDQTETFMLSGKTSNTVLFQSRASHKMEDRKSHRLPLLLKL